MLYRKYHLSFLCVRKYNIQVTKEPYYLILGCVYDFLFVFCFVYIVLYITIIRNHMVIAQSGSERDTKDVVYTPYPHSKFIIIIPTVCREK